MENYETIRREAYVKAMRFKNTGLEEEAIFARLEKQGVPIEIAQEVAKNVAMQKKIDVQKRTPVQYTRYTILAKLLKAIFPKLKI